MLPVKSPGLIANISMNKSMKATSIPLACACTKHMTKDNFLTYISNQQNNEMHAKKSNHKKTDYNLKVKITKPMIKGIYWMYSSYVKILYPI